MNHILKIFRRSTDYDYGDAEYDEDSAEEYETDETTKSYANTFGEHLSKASFTTEPNESDEEATTWRLHTFGKHLHKPRTTTSYFGSQEEDFTSEPTEFYARGEYDERTVFPSWFIWVAFFFIFMLIVLAVYCVWVQKSLRTRSSSNEGSVALKSVNLVESD